MVLAQDYVLRSFVVFAVHGLDCIAFDPKQCRAWKWASAAECPGSAECPKLHQALLGRGLAQLSAQSCKAVVEACQTVAEV